MRHIIFITLISFSIYLPAQAAYYGQYSNNQYNSNSISNKFGTYGNRFSNQSINNPYSQYGHINKTNLTPNSNNYPDNTAQSLKLYDSQGHFRGNLNDNPYDPNSIANPYSRYGNRFSSESINNPYGSGNRYKHDSPLNPYGSGWEIRDN